MKYLITALLITASCQSFSQNYNIFELNRLTDESGDLKARLFGNGVVSTGLNEFNATFTPDLNEFYFSVRHRTDYYSIMVCKPGPDKKEVIEIAEFSGKYNDADPFISSDGKTLYFCSDRFTGNGDTLRDWNIWSMDRAESGWENLRLLPFNTDHKNEMYPSVAKNGNLYFHSDYESKSKNLDFNGTDIYVAEFKDGQYKDFKKVLTVSSENTPEWDPFISPDEDYLIFTSPKTGGFGGGDLYISFMKSEGIWSEPKNMGNMVNSPGTDYCPNLSPDGKLLFFSSYRNELDFSSRPQTYEELATIINGARNGNGDIYYISSNVIAELRQSVY